MGRSRSCFGAKSNGERLKSGAWTPSEDKILNDCIRIQGVGPWKSIAKKSGLKRCAKSCRFRWLNYLRPDIKRGNISEDEEELLIRLHRLLGNRWSLIAGRLPGRSDNEIKNYWNTHLRKRLQMGELEPKLHKPFKRMDMPFHSSNYNEKDVEGIYDGLPQNTALKTRSVRYREKEVVNVENLDGYNCDHIPDTDDGIHPEKEEDRKAADDHVGEIEVSKSWCELLLEDCTGDYRYDRLEYVQGLQTNRVNCQSPSVSPSGSEILEEKQSSSSCNLLEQEFLQTENFISTYFENLVELDELYSILV
eukprot:PITA_25833